MAELIRPVAAHDPIGAEPTFDRLAKMRRLLPLAVPAAAELLVERAILETGGQPADVATRAIDRDESIVAPHRYGPATTTPTPLSDQILSGRAHPVGVAVRRDHVPGSELVLHFA